MLCSKAPLFRCHTIIVPCCCCRCNCRLCLVFRSRFARCIFVRPHCMISLRSRCWAKFSALFSMIMQNAQKFIVKTHASSILLHAKRTIGNAETKLQYTLLSVQHKRGNTAAKCQCSQLCAISSNLGQYQTISACRFIMLSSCSDNLPIFFSFEKLIFLKWMR